jgi:serine protease Do
LQVASDKDAIMSGTVDVAALAAKVGPAVVGLGAGARGGSGVVVGPGRVLTLARNVADEEIELHLAGGGRLTGRVAGRDATLDAAVIAVDGLAAAPVSWAPGDAPEPGIGTPVVALADPAGRGLRATAGAVASAPRGVRGPRGRLVEGVLEHTAPLPRGSGGGPLVDGEGRLLGINAVRRPDGFILAWPAAALRRVVDELATGSHRPPRQLGVAVAPPVMARRLRAAVGLPAQDGVLVHGVRAGSAADAAGLARGDLIVGAGGREVTGLDDLYAALDAAGEGALALEVVRGTEHRDLTADLGGEAVK